MIEIDTILEDAGSEFRDGAKRLPERDWSREPQGLVGPRVAVTAAVAALALFVPLALYLGIVGEEESVPGTPELTTPADVVFEGTDWIVGFWEEAIAGSNGVRFCWEFVAVGRGPAGGDLGEMVCEERLSLEEDSSASHGSLRFELDDAAIWVFELRPGDGSELETRSGRTVALYQGKRMPLSGGDVYVFETSEDAPFNMTRFVPPLGR